MTRSVLCVGLGDVVFVAPTLPLGTPTLPTPAYEHSAYDSKA